MNRRTIFVYLYRLRGEPIYVGQAVDVAARDRFHSGRGKLPFDKFLQKTGRENFSLETVGSTLDWPHGPYINALENKIMDKYRTFWRDSGCGWNFGRAHCYQILTAQHYEAKRAANIAANKKRGQDPRWCAVNAAAQKKSWQNPERAAAGTAANKKLAQDPAWRAANAAAGETRAQDPQWRIGRISATHKAWLRKRAGLLPLKPARAKKIKAGLCGNCGLRPFLPGRTRCHICRDLNRLARLKRAA